MKLAISHYFFFLQKASHFKLPNRRELHTFLPPGLLALQPVHGLEVLQLTLAQLVGQRAGRAQNDAPQEVIGHGAFAGRAEQALELPEELGHCIDYGLVAVDGQALRQQRVDVIVPVQVRIGFL